MTTVVTLIYIALAILCWIAAWRLLNYEVGGFWIVLVAGLAAQFASMAVHRTLDISENAAFTFFFIAPLCWLGYDIYKHQQALHGKDSEEDGSDG